MGALGILLVTGVIAGLTILLGPLFLLVFFGFLVVYGLAHTGD
jgi:hypothetical protein